MLRSFVFSFLNSLLEKSVNTPQFCNTSISSFYFVEEVVIAVDCGIDLFDSSYPFCFSTFQHIFLIQISHRDTDNNMAEAKYTAKDLSYKHLADLNLHLYRFSKLRILTCGPNSLCNNRS